MTRRKTDIVVTTIFEPAWLQGYLDNVRAHGHVEDVTLRIICDRKTPGSVHAAAQAARRQGFQIDCPSLDEQESYLRRLGLPADFIPWNTDNRRNIGFLRAWESGADVLISIDDDNYCRDDSDFVGCHHVVGRPAGTAAAVAAAAPWYNICEQLDLQTGARAYARGYPYAARSPQMQATPAAGTADQAARTVAINAGLWIDDPDVDALTRLVLAPRARRAAAGAVLLAPETWSPINTQNTALMRAAIPAYYYVRMGFPLQGLRIDRFGDILSGYFVQKCAKHLGHTVRIGAPVAEHRRTPHNLFKDLYHELAGVVLVEELAPWLQALRLSGSDYIEAYASLADAIGGEASRFKGFVWDEGGREFLLETAACMRTWLGIVRALA
ncbi:hypothetical protein AAG565_01595 [Fontimonas sp. SYSU GA230001]|uniref:hypothetical protein n=1 Tax=Fontimonas sp. SYSU GA230001 TaxID=3142450 RepID=UPI0032B49151